MPLNAKTLSLLQKGAVVYFVKRLKNYWSTWYPSTMLGKFCVSKWTGGYTAVQINDRTNVETLGEHVSSCIMVPEPLGGTKATQNSWKQLSNSNDFAHYPVLSHSVWALAVSCPHSYFLKMFRRCSAAITSSSRAPDRILELHSQNLCVPFPLQPNSR